MIAGRRIKTDSFVTTLAVTTFGALATTLLDDRAVLPRLGPAALALVARVLK
jgi:hypothetical protein